MANGNPVRVNIGSDSSQLRKDINESVKKLQEFSNKFEDIQEQLSKRGPEEFAKSTEKAIEGTVKKLKEAKDKLAEQEGDYNDRSAKILKMRKDGASKESVDKEYEKQRKLEEEMRKTNEQIVELEEKKTQMIDEATNKWLAETDALEAQAKELENSFTTLNAIMEQDMKDLKWAPFKEMADSVNGMFKNLGGKIKDLFSFKGVGSASKGFKSMATSAKQMFMAMLGAQGAFSLIKKAVTQIKNENKQLANTIETLWNSLIALVTPAVNYLVQLLATALNYVIAIVSKISSINLIGKMKQANQEAKKNAKKNSGSSNLYSFDTSETLKGNGTEASYLKEIELNEELLGLAEKLKAIWNDITTIVSNIVDRIKEGLEFMNSGKRIVEVFKEIGGALLEDIKRITEATVEWSKNIDFGPLFDGVASVMESLEPILEDVGNLLVWIWTEIVLPLATYVIEDLLPAIADVLSPALEIISNILDRLAETLGPLWNDVLSPLFEALGQGIVDVLNGIGDALQWIADHEGITDFLVDFAEVIGIIALAIEAYNLAASLGTGITALFTGALDLLGTSLMFLVQNPFVLLIAIIVVAIAWFVKMMATNEEFRDKVLKIWDAIVLGVKGAVVGLANVLIALWNLVVGIVEGLINVVAIGIETLLNKLVDMVNAVISAADVIAEIFGFEIELWEHVTIGRADFSAAKLGYLDVNLGEIPHLAKGAVIPPNQEFLAMLGDQTRGRNIEAPEGLLREIVQEESGSQEINIVANGSLSEFIKLLRFELQKEDKRVGTNLVIGG